MNHEASFAKKICHSKFLNTFLFAWHLHRFYTLHKKLIQKVGVVLSMRPFHFGVAEIFVVNRLYNQYINFRPIDSSIRKHSTFQSLCALNYVEFRAAMHPVGYMTGYVQNEFMASHAPYVVHGGGSRIRTHVPFRGNGFQDRRHRPLGHPSSRTTKGKEPGA